MGSQPSRPDEEQKASLLSDVDAACGRAAANVAQADIFLLCTGAGFSADSGLAVYADVAKVDAYKERCLEYHDICQPRWLQTDPDLFWGFWGQCYNDYRETAPHDGYAIIEKWAAQRFRKSKIARQIRDRLEQSEREEVPSQEADQVMYNDEGRGVRHAGTEAYQVLDHAGAFFAFTSNVDAHHFDFFRACEIRECHGNTELYSCAADCRGTWRAPSTFRFEVDKQTMLAPNCAALTPEEAAKALELKTEGSREPSTLPRIGQVSGGGRPKALTHMPPCTQEVSAAFLKNHPTCPTCGGPARPAILMFGDGRFQDLRSQDRRWERWKQVVSDIIEETGHPIRIAILELGAGPNVTTVRGTSEDCFDVWQQLGADVHFIRVNPDFPLGDSESLKSDACKHRMTSIMARGRETLHKIDLALASHGPPRWS